MAESMATFLMFQDGRAEEAMRWYVSLFGGTIERIDRWGEDEPGETGRVKYASFTLAGHALRCMDSPPVHAFGFTPSVSLFVDCADEAEVDRLFTALSEGGQVRMPLGEYEFSRRFGRCNDRYGVSWQISLV